MMFENISSSLIKLLLSIEKLESKYIYIENFNSQMRSIADPS